MEVEVEPVFKCPASCFLRVKKQWRAGLASPKAVAKEAVCSVSSFSVCMGSPSSSPSCFPGVQFGSNALQFLQIFHPPQCSVIDFLSA